MASRWAERVRAAGRPEAAVLLENWLDAEGGWSALASMSGTDGTALDAAPEDAMGRAFVRLGGGACDAGLELDDLAGIMGALHLSLTGDGGGDEGRASAPGTQLALLHGLAAGAWHAGCGAPLASGSAGDQGLASGAAPSGPSGSVPALDPVLAKLIRHDIKTPLQAASLNLELLAMEQEGNASVTGAIETIMQSLDSAVEMLQRFDNV